MEKSEDNFMWVEKYRPETLDQVVDLKDVVESIKAFLKTPKTMPHLLLAGMPGTGKTTVALCIARQLFGPNWRTFTLELNASDERGIKIVRERIKDFARYARAAFGDIPYVIIILDESDQMTGPAQTALRRIMETYSRNCRFIFICNYSSKIIEPIQSRCAIFRFSMLDKGDMKRHLEYISQNENFTLLPDAAEAIVEYSGGDLRRAINALHTASVYAKTKTVNKNATLQVIGDVSPKRVQLMLNKALSGDFVEARRMMYELMGLYGFSGTDIIRQLHKEIFKVSNLETEKKAELANIIGEYDFRLVEGATDDIQLSALLAQFSRFGKSKGNNY